MPYSFKNVGATPDAAVDEDRDLCSGGFVLAGYTLNPINSTNPVNATNPTNPFQPHIPYMPYNPY